MKRVLLIAAILAIWYAIAHRCESSTQNGSSQDAEGFINKQKLIELLKNFGYKEFNKN